jgi:hypothetical protein
LKNDHSDFVDILNNVNMKYVPMQRSGDCALVRVSLPLRRKCTTLRTTRQDNMMLAQLETTTEYDLPQGYFMRGATLDDLPEAVEMFNACSRKLIGTAEVTLAGLRHEWEIPILNLEDRRVVIARWLVGIWSMGFSIRTRASTRGRVHPAPGARHRGGAGVLGGGTRPPGHSRAPGARE